jgi:hypothetical protein
MDNKQQEEYELIRSAVMKNFRINKNTGSLHADLISKDGELLISATTEYIQGRVLRVLSQSQPPSPAEKAF